MPNPDTNHGHNAPASPLYEPASRPSGAHISTLHACIPTLLACVATLRACIPTLRACIPTLRDEPALPPKSPHTPSTRLYPCLLARTPCLFARIRSLTLTEPSPLCQNNQCHNPTCDRISAACIPRDDGGRWPVHWASLLWCISQLLNLVPISEPLALNASAKLRATRISKEKTEGTGQGVQQPGFGQCQYGATQQLLSVGLLRHFRCLIGYTSSVSISRAT